MNHTINEQLSALMDGELERDQTRFLLKRLQADDDLSLRWARYHVVRQTLRRQEVVLAAGFADRVMAEIDAAPARKGRVPHAWLRWGAGGAIAASVAAAALVLTQPPEITMEPAVARGPASSPAQLAAVPQVAIAPVAATSAPTAAAFRPPMLAPSEPIETAPASFGSDVTQSIVIDPRLQSYVIRHYQSAGAGGQTAVVPYVLLAAPQRETPAQAAPQNR